MPATTLRRAASLLVLMSIVLGIAYPMLVTGIAIVAFPHQAHGSLVSRNGQLVGSSVIGQNFAAPGYFWGRPSATTPQPYNGLASTGSNLGPMNPALIDGIRAHVAALRDADPGNPLAVPVDLATASASGLDPDISPAAAHFQVARVARARGLGPQRVEALVAAHVHGRLLGLFGEPRLNVLELNLALDRLN